ncbi:MAG: hypothetical protein IPN81_10425 [Nitrosomonadales bacterium]|nr:hypothetical protein [Nitrosomonadales bacterium]
MAVLLPYVLPMQGYVAQIEQKLSAQLQQPVHVGHLRATLLPSRNWSWKMYPWVVARS